MLPDMYRLTSELRQSFENLFDRWHDAGCRLSEQEKTQLIDLEARFSVWGRTVGAFRRSQSSASLDSRLVTAARLRQHIADNLELLACALIDIEQIGFGMRENREVALRELTDDERMLKEFEAELAAASTSFRHLTTTVDHTTTTFACTELADELILANHVVASLLRTAVYITDNAPRERYFRSQRATVADLFRDIGHLKDKFPYLDRNKPWLLERLARANVSTRQYLTYREDHYDNIAQSDEDDEARASQSSQRDGRSRPSTEATKVSQDIDPTTLEKDDGQSESASSITPSVVGSLAVRFPALPEELGSGKIFCPLCRTIINLGSSKPRERWHKHVLHDLEPYVCTFDKCTESSFPSRRQWFEHEVRVHRQLWSCQICKNLITRRLEEFEAHISKCLVRHRDSSATDPSDISLLIRACQSPMRVVKPAECPFCGYDWLQIHVGVSHSDTSVSLQAYRAHVGEHLLDEALFSLRQMHLEWEDEGEDETTYAGSSASSAALLEDDSLSEVRESGDLLTHSVTSGDREDRADVALPEEVADIIASREDDPDESISSGRDHDFVSSGTLIREHEADDNEDWDDEVAEIPRDVVTASKDFVLPNKLETAHDDAEETANPDTARSSSLPLPADFEIKASKVFQVGRVFRFLSSEPAGIPAATLSASKDQSVYTTLRLMVVVKRMLTHAICVPISSYGGRGVGKPGLRAQEVAQHAVIHMAGHPPRLSSEEQHWASIGRINVEDAFTVHPTTSKSSLHHASRIRFDTPYTVKYNVKVQDFGIVIRSQRARLQERWREANS